MTQLENKSGLMIGGGIFAAFAASLCCIGPLVLTLLGISGAAILSKFEILRWPMIFVVTFLFTVAGYSLYRKRKACEPGSLCADPKKWRQMAIAYWFGLSIAVIAISSPYLVAWIFG